MNMRTPWLGFVLLALLVAGCGSDTPTGDTPAPVPGRTVIGSGDVAEGSFLMRADGPSGSDLTFSLRGENLRYEEGELVADFVAINDGDAPVALPAALTLVTIDPGDVTVAGADNGETGAGASFDLEFEQDDLEWNVGEESLPETLRFTVDEGVAIALVARIDVAMQEMGGSIGGTVFEDLDVDGEFDADENGVGGVLISLTGEGVDTSTETDMMGAYRFDGLDAGAYTVSWPPIEGVEATTPTTLQILLPAVGDTMVADYLTANFGVTLPSDDDEPFLAEGDFVEVTGRWDGGSAVLYADEVELEWDDDERPELRGPVTDVWMDEAILGVMGVAVSVDDLEISGGGPADECKDRPALDFEVGDRARLWIDGVAMAATDSTEAVWDAGRVMCWSSPKDKVHGEVEGLELDENENVVAFTVLGVRVEVTGRTEFEDDDHDDDDDDAHDDDEDDDDDDDDDDMS